MHRALLLGLLCLLPPLGAAELLYDDASDRAAWSTTLGGEFPGAKGSVTSATDDARGDVLAIDYDFTAGGRYVGAIWHGAIDTAEAIVFDVRATDPGHVMVRLRDATGQEFLGGVTAQREWQHVVLPIDGETFRQHWGGANDGVVHFPIRRVTLAPSAQGRPPTGRLFVDDLAAQVTVPAPEQTWQLRLVPPEPAGLVLPGEPAALRVELLNRLDQPRRATVRLALREPHGAGPLIEQAWNLDVPGHQRAVESLELATDAAGYRSARATLEAEGGPLGEVESGYAVVPPRRVGELAPRDGYFGVQMGLQPDAAERMGVGALRVWAKWEFILGGDDVYRWDAIDREMEAARRNGWKVLLTLNAEPPGRLGWQVEGKPKLKRMPAPEHLNRWREFVRLAAERYRDVATAIEIQNEPDLLVWKHLDIPLPEAVDLYTMLLTLAHEEIKRVAPDMPVAALDVSGGDFERGFEFSRPVMERAAPRIDLFTGHPYASPRYFGTGLSPKWPEVNQQREKCLAALDLMTEYGRPRRMWIGELGWALSNVEPALGEPSLDFAACIARSLVLGKSVEGVEHYLYFTMKGADEGGHSYGLFRGEPSYPLPAALAYATCAAMLDGAAPAGDIPLGPSLRAWRFNHADGRPVIALWAVDEPTALEPALPASASGVDSWGRELPAGRLAIGRLPVYLTAAPADGDALAAALGAARMGAADALRVDQVRLARADLLRVRLTNHGNAPLPVSVEVLRPGDATRRETLPPGTHEWTLALPPQSGAVDIAVRVSAGEVSSEHRLQRELLPLGTVSEPIDGEGGPAPAFAVSDRASVLPPDPGVGWDGPDDLSFSGAAAATADGLYLWVAVRDDVVHEPSGAASFWNGDGLQVALDPDNDSKGGYDDDDREIGLFTLGGRPQIALSYPRSAPLGGTLAVRDTRGERVYEALIPWAELAMAPLQPGQVVALNVIANENDGQGRVYWMGLTPGIGEGKAPEVYRRFVVGGQP